MTITTAKKDGHNLAMMTCNRITPAHSTIEAVYNGLIEVHSPFCSMDFQREFYKNIGVRNEQ